MPTTCTTCGRDPASPGSGRPDCPDCKDGVRPRPPAPRPRDPGFRARHSVEAGSVISMSARIWVAHLPPFVAVTMIVLSPMLLYGIYMASLDPMEITQGKASIYDSVHMLGGGLLRTMVSAAIIAGVFGHLRGDRVEFGSIFGKGLARVFPALWTGILAGVFMFLPMAIPVVLFAVAAGTGGTGVAALAGVLSIVALVLMMMISTALYVSVPTSVVEKMNGLAALKRSMTLTKGHRGQIFVILLAIGVLGFIVNFAIQKSGSYSSIILLSLVADVIGASFAGVFAGVVYYNLRATKEGIGIEALAKVFD
jgi:hypothetical protein